MVQPEHGSNGEPAVDHLAVDPAVDEVVQRHLELPTELAVERLDRAPSSARPAVGSAVRVAAPAEAAREIRPVAGIVVRPRVAGRDVPVAGRSGGTAPSSPRPSRCRRVRHALRHRRGSRAATAGSSPSGRPSSPTTGSAPCRRSARSSSSNFDEQHPVPRRERRAAVAPAVGDVHRVHVDAREVVVAVRSPRRLGFPRTAMTALTNALRSQRAWWRCSSRGRIAGYSFACSQRRGGTGATDRRQG